MTGLLHILGHTLHYSSSIKLGGEIRFCLNTLCPLTLDEIIQQMEIHFANILAMLAYKQGFKVLKQ